MIYRINPSQHRTRTPKQKAIRCAPANFKFISPTRDHLPASKHPPNFVPLPLSIPAPNSATVPLYESSSGRQ
jgi:hypothetical protein